jgi:phage replication O-like protein O
MASPQKENGFTGIANEILDHLSMPGINGSEYRILLAVIRKTYGFNKKKDRISLTQFEKLTSMNRAHVVRTIKELVSKRILLKDGTSYLFNKNWEEWVVEKRGGTQKDTSTQMDTTASTQKDTKSSTQKDTHKRKKDNITKDTTEQSSALIAEVIHLFEEVNPACKRMYGRPVQRQACQDLIDTYGFEEIKKVIAFLPKNNSSPFKPKANTPLQLWEKIQSIKDSWIQEKARLQTKQREVIL